MNTWFLCFEISLFAAWKQLSKAVYVARHMELRIAIKDGLLDLTPPRNRRRIMKMVVSCGRPIALLGVGRREVRRFLIPCTRAWPPYARTRCQSSPQRTSPRYSACSRAPCAPQGSRFSEVPPPPLFHFSHAEAALSMALAVA